MLRFRQARLIEVCLSQSIELSFVVVSGWWHQQWNACLVCSALVVDVLIKLHQMKSLIV